MSSHDASAISTLTVFLCRLAIGVTGALWLSSSDWLSFAVAAAALLLTVPPTLFLRESPLRDVAAPLIALLLAAHIVLGMKFGLYEVSMLYDKAMHFIGSGAIAVILVVATRTYSNRSRVVLPAPLVLLLVFAGTLSAGTLWEIFEFAIDLTGLFVAQRSLQDTMIDLLADTLGALLVVSLFAATGVSRAV